MHWYSCVQQLSSCAPSLSKGGGGRRTEPLAVKHEDALAVVGKSKGHRHTDTHYTHTHTHTHTHRHRHTHTHTHTHTHGLDWPYCLSKSMEDDGEHHFWNAFVFIVWYLLNELFSQSLRSQVIKLCIRRHFDSDLMSTTHHVLISYPLYCHGHWHCCCNMSLLGMYQIIFRKMSCIHYGTSSFMQHVIQMHFKWVGQSTFYIQFNIIQYLTWSIPYPWSSIVPSQVMCNRVSRVRELKRPKGHVNSQSRTTTNRLFSLFVVTMTNAVLLFFLNYSSNL